MIKNSPFTHCDSTSQMTSPNSVQDLMENVGKPGSLGLIAGYCAGGATRIAFKAVALTCGAGVALLQLGQSYGYLNVNWDLIQRDSSKLVSSFKGEQVQFKQLEGLAGSVSSHLGVSLGTFMTGFYLAMRK